MTVTRKEIQLSTKRLAIFIPSLCGGGAERVMVTLANEFAARGYLVDLVLARAEGPYLAEIASNVRIVDLQKGRVLACLLPLAIYLRRERPAAMLSALNHANIVAIVARSLSRTKMRIVVSERNSLSHCAPGMTERGLRWLMRRLYPAADAVVAVSQAMATEIVTLLRVPLARVHSIPNPVDGERLRVWASEKPYHPWLSDRRTPVVLAVGRLEPQKDYPTLLSALALLRAERPVRLVILGEGGQRAELERLIARLGLDDSVELAGFRENPFGWMAACDLFVLSSRNEGFPNVLVQALACGAKVIATDCPTGPAEILESGRWGRLVPVGDAEALAQAMAEVLDDSASEVGPERVSAFNVNLCVSKYEAVLVGARGEPVTV